jgi:hypothetical protein
MNYKKGAIFESKKYTYHTVFFSRRCYFGYIGASGSKEKVSGEYYYFSDENGLRGSTERES